MIGLRCQLPPRLDGLSQYIMFTANEVSYLVFEASVLNHDQKNLGLSDR
jgi:hypothetical protein